MFADLTGLTPDIVALLKRRVYDVAGTSNKKNSDKLSVYLNGKRLPIQNFKDYVSCFIDKSVAPPAWEIVNEKYVSFMFFFMFSIPFTILCLCVQVGSMCDCK